MITSAIAEAASTATEATSSVGFELNISTIVMIAICGYIVFIGLASLITGKVYGMGKTASKYTDESLAKYARPYGLAELLAGVALFGIDWYLTVEKNQTFLYAGIALIVVAVIVLIFGSRSLVKKDNA